MFECYCDYCFTFSVLNSLSLSLADFLEDYLFLTVGRVGGATSDIQQKVIEIGEYERRDKLIEILSSAGTEIYHCTAGYIFVDIYYTSKIKNKF